jgi:hypothetical protein
MVNTIYLREITELVISHAYSMKHINYVFLSDVSKIDQGIWSSLVLKVNNF